MISDREQRALREVEHGLVADDPAFARSFHARATGVGTRVLRTVSIILAAVCGLVLAVLMLATGAVGSCVAFLFALGLAGWLHRSRQQPSDPPAPPA